MIAGARGRYAHAYGIWSPFYCISLKKYEAGGITLLGVWFQGTLPNCFLFKFEWFLNILWLVHFVNLLISVNVIFITALFCWIYLVKRRKIFSSSDSSSLGAGFFPIGTHKLLREGRKVDLYKKIFGFCVISAW